MQVFRWILEEVAEAGYLSPRAVFIDGMHVKANANTKKQIKVQVSAASKQYAKELMDEVNEERLAHGKKPFDDNDEPPAAVKKRRDNTSKKKLSRRKKEDLRAVTRSVTDPEAACLSRETTSGSLPMRPTRPAASMDLFWRPSLPPETHMTV